MLAEFSASNFTDTLDLPAGGMVDGVGLSIQWQSGPLGKGDNRVEPNGAFVETVIAAAMQRLKWYQEVNEGRFQCEENRWAIQCLDSALVHLDNRTHSRELRGVEGTHEE